MNKKIFFAVVLGFACAVVTPLRAQFVAGNAIRLDGATGYVASAPTDSVTSSFTVEAWVRPNRTNTMNVFSTRLGASDMVFDFKLENGTLVHGDIGSGSAWLTTVADAPLAYATNIWYHLAYVVTPTRYAIFTNGHPAGSGTFASATPLLFNPSQTISVGSYDGSVEFWNGDIDEVRVWSTARSDSQILTNYQRRAVGNEAGLELLWHFDEQLGSTTADASGHGHVGTLHPTTTFVASGAPILPYPPAVTNLAATSLTTNSSVVNAALNPGGGVTSYYFKYGTTASYGSFSTTNTVAAGNATVTVSNLLTGLIPGTVYHYNIVATNSGGTNTGTDVTFRTPGISIVNNTNDDGRAGSLRVTVTNAQPGDFIHFASGLAGQTILLTNGEITLNQNLTIDASALPGGIFINGAAHSRMFEVAGGSSVLLDSLTLTNGFPGAGNSGGAIESSGTLALNRCTFSGNYVDTNDSGGAIASYSVVTLNRCTLFSNSAAFAGAIEVIGACSLTNCTLAANTALYNGGAIDNNTGALALLQCTFLSNTADTGGAIDNYQGTITLTNCLVAGNTANAGGDIYVWNLGVLTVEGTNILQSLDNTGTNLGAGTLLNVAPLLAPLGFYGGPTQTLPPLPGSPAVDAGSDVVTNFLTVDERGFPRLAGAHVDIGADEAIVSPAFPAVPFAVAYDNANLADYAPQPVLGWPADNGGYGYGPWTSLFALNNGGTYMEVMQGNVLPVDTSFAFELLANAFPAGVGGFAISRPLSSALSSGEFSVTTSFTSGGTGTNLISLRAGNSSASFASGELLSFGIVNSSQLGYQDAYGYHLIPSGNANSVVWNWSVAFDTVAGTFSLSVMNAGGGFAYAVAGNLESGGGSVGSFAVENSTTNGGQSLIFNSPTFSVATNAVASQPPSLNAEPIVDVTASGLVLETGVDPDGAATGVYFQYGATTNYGSVSAVLALPNGNATVSASQTLSLLLAGGLYHFRAVATNSAGVTFGNDQTVLLPACADQGSVVPATSPNLQLATAGTLWCSLRQPDGSLIIGGLFDSVNDIPRFNLARLNPNGSVDATWQPAGIVYNVYAMAQDGTNLYIGGNFGVTNFPPHSFLAKLSTVTGNFDSNWSVSLDGEVDALALDGTNLYVGGLFNSVNGQSAPHLARLNETTAQFDAGWLPKPDNDVDALLVNNGNVFAGGLFSNIGGHPIAGVAKIPVNGNGAADPSWNPAPGDIQPFYEEGINALAFDGTNLFIGGAFTGLGTNNINSLAKINAATGAVATDWVPNPDSLVLSLAVTNGSVYFGGPFAHVNGAARNNLAKVTAASGAALDPNWHPDPGFGVGLAEGGRTIVSSLAPFGSGVVAGGNFTTIDGAVSLAIAQLDSLTGARDATYAGQVQAPAPIEAIVQQPDGKFILGGDIWSAQGLPRQNLLRVNQDGSLDSTWAPNVNGVVYALALDGTNLYIGGSFTKVSNVTNNSLAKLTTLSLDAINVADTNWNSPLADGGSVRALALAGQNLYIGGSFTDSSATLGNLVRSSVSGTGALDPSWNPNPDSYVFSLLTSGTSLFAGGEFTMIGNVPRTALAKLSTTSPAVDPNWNPVLTQTNDPGLSVGAMATDNTNLFIGGHFSDVDGVSRVSLAKLSASGVGALDPAWNPGIVPVADGFDSVLTIALAGSYLYFGGGFIEVNTSFNPYFFQYLARVSAGGVGAVDPSWSPGADGSANSPPTAFLAVGNDLYVGGNFDTIGGQNRAGFALLPSPAAPMLFQDTLTNLYIVPNLQDGPGTTCFHVNAIFGGTLFHRDGVTPIQCGDFIAASEAAVGLPFQIGASINVSPAVNNTPGSTSPVTATYTMVNNPAPVVALSSAQYSVTEGQGSVVITVRKFGAGPAQVNYATTAITATSGLSYLDRSGTLFFAASDTQKTVFIPIADNFTVVPDETFSFALSSVPGAVNSQIVSPASAIVTIVDNNIFGDGSSLLTNVAPAAPPSAGGVVTVSLQPPGVLGQWRLLGELNWHNSGDQVLGLVTGNYQLEFRAISNYYQPATVTEAITGNATNSFTFFYTGIPTFNQALLGLGSLTTTIQPDAVATNANPALRGQWQIQGDTNWHNSGDVVSNLALSSYTIVYSFVSNYQTPAPQIVQIANSGLYAPNAIATYLFAPPQAGVVTPQVVPFATAVGTPPYLYNGQIQTSVGFASGFVVKPRVVLTAAHELFDDSTLSYVTEALWFYQRYQGQLEPVPLVAAGWYINDGYAQARFGATPDISTPASQQDDAAAMYFLTDAARGGYGGYLAADAPDSDLLSDNLKMLVGYPVDGISTNDQGKLFATTPANLSFTNLYNSVFATTNILSYPGNSGGPLYVQANDGNYYPAAIFLGGSGETLVRCIDSDVVDLLNRADAAGNGGGNFSGGGVATLNAGTTKSAAGVGLLTVTLSPSLPGFLPGWRITGNSPTNYITNASSVVSLVAGGSYPIEFKPVPGFITPTNRTLSIAVNQLATTAGDYVPISPVLNFSSLTNLSFTGGVGATYRLEFATNLQAPIIWTPLSTQLVVSGSFTITNLRPITNRASFYRLRLLP